MGQDDDGSMATVYGAGAFVVGYVLTYVLKAGAAERWIEMGAGTVPSVPAVWKVVGQTYYVMHNVDMTASFSTPQQSQSVPIDPTTGVNVVWDPWLLIVPALSLLVAGYLAAQSGVARSAEDGAKTGALVVAGYLPAVILGVFLTQWNLELTRFGTTWSVTYGPNLLQSVLIAGVVYPVVGGGIGGYVYGSRTRLGPTDTPTREPQRDGGTRREDQRGRAGGGGETGDRRTVPAGRSASPGRHSGGSRTDTGLSVLYRHRP